jgi:putative ABC transport system permease protein
VKGLAWRSALDRPLSLAGSFVALALSVGLLGAMTLTIVSAVSGTRLQPRWFTRAAVVVAGDDTVSVTTGTGDDRETGTVRTPAARAVPAALAARLASLVSTGSGAAAVTDYAGYGQAAGAPGQAIHPWAAAGLHPYRWVAGGPPDGPGQLVLTAPARYAPGQPVTVQTAAGPRRFTVSGVLATPAPPAFYATGAVARQLAGNRISAVALTPRAGQDAAALAREARSDARGLPVQVLTGDRRALAGPDPDGDLVAVASALLGSAAGVAGFVSMIVLAGTFGYAVAARRRELGLLRTTGATPRQVRRLVLGEALITGAAGAAAGTALGPVIAGPFAALLAREGFAPAGLAVHVIFWPLAAAFGAGLLIALGGALAAARRAGRTRPAEALREAGRDRRVMTAFRWAAGPAALAGAAVLFAVLGGMHSADGEALVLPIVLLLILGAALLLPVLIRPLAGLVAALPLAGSRGAAWRLARSAAAGSRRRTAAVLAPVLLTVAFAGAMTAGFGTFSTATHRAAATRVTAPYVATARSSAGLAAPAVARLAAAPGVTAAVPVATAPVYVAASGEPDEWTGEYLPGPQAARVLKLPVVAGSLADLTGTGTVAVPAGRWRVGQTAQLWLGDSAPVRLRVVAVYASQLDLSQTVLLPWALHAAHTGTPLASAVYLRLDPGARLAGVRAAAQAAGAAIAPTARYLAAGQSENDRVSRMAMLILLGLALLYTAVGIANTLVMTIGDRRTELAVLRLSGATRGQVLRMLAAEATLTTTAAVLLAGLVIAVTAVGVRAGLAETTPAVPLDLPWAAAGGVAGACLLIALTATLIPAALALRERPAAAAGLAA